MAVEARERVRAQRAGGVAAVVVVAIAVGAVGTSEGCSSSKALSCPAQALACPSLDGLTSFCRWADWGCTSATTKTCDGYYAIVDQGVDARFIYFYAAGSGAYVATVREGFGGGEATCINGPGSFTMPGSCAYTTVAECAPIVQDGGVEPVDAAFVDAGDAGNPGGSPSSQPLGRTRAGF